MKRPTLCVAWVAFLAFRCADARAQSKEDLARADEVFNAAKALTDAGRYADACAKFAESKRLVPGLGVTLYLADCYERIGRNASAWAEFRSAEGLARERNDKRAEVARSRAQALEPSLNRLTISLSPRIARGGLQVLRDGLPVASEELGLSVPVDPGDHVVVVSAPGHEARTFDVHVGPEHPTATVEIDPIDSAAPAVSAPAPPAPATAVPGAAVEASTASGPALARPTNTPPPAPLSAAASTSNDRWIALGLGGLGAATVGLGGAFGLVAMSKRDASNAGATPPCDAKDTCTAEGLSLRKDAESMATASTVAIVVGGAALAAGVGWYVIATRTRTSVAGVILAPVPMTGGAGAILRARF